jgi:hypothetical protein
MSTLSPLGPLCEERDRVLHQGIDFHITVAHCPLVREVKKGEKKFDIKKRGFPLPKHAEHLGRDRFGPEDLLKWQKEHPFAPSGKPPQVEKAN